MDNNMLGDRYEKIMNLASAPQPLTETPYVRDGVWVLGDARVARLFLENYARQHYTNYRVLLRYKPDGVSDEGWDDHCQHLTSADVTMKLFEWQTTDKKER